MSLHPAGREVSSALDTILQIRLFVKLKFTKCAPIPGPPAIGFFVRVPSET
jgi:hypothetical protein